MDGSIGKRYLGFIFGKNWGGFVSGGNDNSFLIVSICRFFK